MTFKRTSFLIVLFFSLGIQAQNQQLGKVSVSELEEKAYPDDTTAVAAITFKKGSSKFKYNQKSGFALEHEYEFRIKIYKKEGLSWANFSIPYYTGYKEMKNDYVEFSNAVTYNLENGKIVRTKLNSEGRFKKEITENWSEASIVLPNVKVGSVIEFKYTLKTEDIVEFPVFRFQYDIPVKYCEYVTVIPEYYVYKPILSGFGFVSSNQMVVTGSQSFENEYKQTVHWTYNAANSSYISMNVPAMKDEVYVDNVQNYRSSLSHELEKTRFPNGEGKSYSTTWEAVAQNIYKENKFGNELRERQYFEPYIAPYIKSSDTELEKATAVFGFIKRTMTWDSKYGYLTRKGVKKAFADKSGNVAEINLMLVSMLNHAGIKAYPVLISTVENGVAVFPSRGIFNYVIASAEIDGKQVLFDATSKNAAPGILPFRDLNWDGWLIKNDGTAVKTNLIPKQASNEFVAMAAKISSQGHISGKLRIQKTDYFGFGFREEYNGIDKDSYLEQFENRMNNIAITDYKVENSDDVSKPVIEVFDFTSENSTEIIGDKMYINPLLFFTQDKSPFIAAKRILPVYYAYPRQYKYVFSIEIPEGYEVESIPTTGAISTGENVGSYNIAIELNRNAIQITATQDIKQTIVASEFYNNLSGFYEKMINLQSKKIVLKKL
jgi:hypothetical protein